jgi:hypothetical protein
MNKLLIALCLAVGFASPSFAADKKEPTAQQSKMGACNKEAGEKALKGDERKKFMSDCLKAKAPEAAKDAAPAKESAAPKEAAAPKEKLTPMATCNKAAGEKALKGDERKKFMSACLKAKGPENMK